MLGTVVTGTVLTAALAAGTATPFTLIPAKPASTGPARILPAGSAGMVLLTSRTSRTSSLHCLQGLLCGVVGICGVDGVDVFVFVGVGRGADGDHELFMLGDGHVPIEMDEPAPWFAEEQSLFSQQVPMAGLVPVRIKMADDPVPQMTGEIRAFFPARIHQSLFDFFGDLRADLPVTGQPLGFIHKPCKQ